MALFGLDGVSFFKLFITGLVWVSFGVAFLEYIKFNHILKQTLPKLAFIVLSLLLIWNVFNVFRSIFNRDGSLTTILGNVAASLAILVPFVIIFSVHLSNIRIFHHYLIKVLKLATIIFIGLFLFYGTSISSSNLRLLLMLLVPVLFLITVLNFEIRQHKIIVMCSALFLFYTAYLFSTRAMMLRLVLLFMSIFAVNIYHRFKVKWILVLSFLVISIPFLLLQESYSTGSSAFEKYLSSDSDDELNTDTRTFLYMELYEDLIANKKLLIGKGANGTYYSAYFSEADINETDQRNNIEVGVLGLLLKGGIVAVVLNLLILGIAIYFAFFKTRNIYTVGLGYILIIHTILLFLENYTIYSSYNFFIWFFIGVCLSKKARSLTNRQIFVLINTKN